MSHRLKSSHKKFKKDSKTTLYKGLEVKKNNRDYEKETYLEELSHRLHLPADLIAGAPIITATGRNELCLENYKGIIEFNCNLLRILTKICRICIEGKHLNILYFTEDEMRITGNIKAIYYQ